MRSWLGDILNKSFFSLFVLPNKQRKENNRLKIAGDAVRAYVQNSANTVEFMALKFGEINLSDQLPPGFDYREWYGIYALYDQGTHFDTEARLSPFLTLSKASVDWTVQQPAHTAEGVLILVKMQFLNAQTNENLSTLPLFIHQGYGPFLLNRQQLKELMWITDKIWNEMNSRYQFKSEYLMALVLQIVHFVVRNFTSAYICKDSCVSLY